MDADSPSDPLSAREIARRLHDDVCQVLSATALHTAILERKLKARHAAETVQATEIRASLEEAAQKLRALMKDLQTFP